MSEQVRDRAMLKQMQDLPLELKIRLTQDRIREWYEHWDGEVSVSFSGGKDSTVLLDIAREMYPDIEAVFVDTGLEYPEIRKFVKTFDNVTWLKPEMRFDEVITRFGYPAISKSVSHNVAIARRNPYGNIRTKIFEQETGIYGMKKWLPLLSENFRLCDKCCDITKKSQRTNINSRAAKCRLQHKWRQRASCASRNGYKTVAMPLIHETLSAIQCRFGQSKISCFISSRKNYLLLLFTAISYMTETSLIRNGLMDMSPQNSPLLAVNEQGAYSARLEHISKKRVDLRGYGKPTRNFITIVLTAASLTRTGCGFQIVRDLAWDMYSTA